MNLPNADAAQIDRIKITEYLLSTGNPRGRAKANFFIGFGFSADRWEEFAQALRQHATLNQIGFTVGTEYGLRFHIDGTLETPDGRDPQIRTVWQTDIGSSVPRLITAYPLRR